MAWGNSDTFDLTVSDLNCQDCVYTKIVDILEAILGKIRLNAFI
jgi:hypothetical protein